MNIRTKMLPYRAIAVAFFTLIVSLGTVFMHAAQQTVSLHKAAKSGDVATVKTLLTTKEGRAQLNQPRGIMRNTPLHWAAHNGHIDAIEILLSVGADGRAEDRAGLTPLMCAAWRGREAVVRYFLDRGANLSEKSSRGHTVLHWGVSCGEALVRLLLERGADVNAIGPYGLPLHRAVVHNRGSVARLLLERGAAIDAVDKDGQTPLHNAAKGGLVPIVRLLLECGADIDAVDQDGKTPLRIALEAKQKAMQLFLLGCGADVEALDIEENRLLHVVRGGRAPSFDWEEQCQLRKHWDSRPKWFDYDWKHPIVERLEAIELWRDRLAQVLPEKAVEFVLECALTEAQCRNLAELSTWHAVEKSLHDAARRGHEIEVEALLKTDAGRAQIDQGERIGEMPLHLAGSNGSGAVARLLLSYGADVDARDKRNNTALHLAALEGHEDVARMLLDHGADIDALPAHAWVGRHPGQYVLDDQFRNRLVHLVQERLRAIQVWAERLHLKAGLPRALVEQLILEKMVLTDNQRRRLEALEAQ